MQFLQHLSVSSSIDLLYLDSYDADWGNTHPSALHHLMELCAVIPKQDHALIVVDDNLPLHCTDPDDLRAWYGQMAAVERVFSDTVGLHGKGEYVDRFMRTIGKRFDYARYPDEAFFVDDDWIAGNLARQQVKKIVLAAAGLKSRHDQVLGIELGNGLNSKDNAARNIHCQEVLLTRFTREGLLPAAGF